MLAVAVVTPGAADIQVAWCGDCRVYRSGRFGLLEQVTEDHTQGALWRRTGRLQPGHPLCQLDSVVTSRLAEGEIGSATIPAHLAHRVLVCSDGIGKQLDADDIAFDLGDVCTARETAENLAQAADVGGLDPDRTYSDNITAVVLDLAQTPTGETWTTARTTPVSWT
ncbi:hypothetical protein GCM10029964_092930 [Kibdelosporangium lantanae]